MDAKGPETPERDPGLAWGKMRDEIREVLKESPLFVTLSEAEIAEETDQVIRELMERHAPERNIAA